MARIAKEQLAVAADGTAIHGYVEGAGPPLLVLHPGMDDGRSWARVTHRLADRFRTIRLHRRTYRLDQEVEAATSMAVEVRDVLAVADAIDEPCLLIGHSSGGVVALEALAAAPGTFAGAVVYEAPVPIGGPLGGRALERARAALDRNAPGAALTIFMREIVGYPPWLSRVYGILVGAVPALRARVPRQIVDTEAIDDTGVRLDAYGAIDVPVLLLLGERSPAHLADRTGALATAVPRTRIARLAGQEHNANRRAPDRVARLVAEFAHDVFRVGGQR
ncbi:MULTISPECIES: alpha/beta fold hydrolase [Pseudonocardia]|uniref:Short chain dehydrogenase n=2 Tax=Pseudonocardia TaxID=1847 RepID=A0A1Y2MWL6_PSEAH|nr:MULTISPECIES: alpha/beta hydrolase [Pseudonocardia]OSY39217.1 short chain dehydrogenase [Pseudonocardia autotrophica]TDN76561.1 pimeloyl-ACP methyl ester carboxylesterase [Pseudonocardia autotrophica]BBG00561.1 hypothetical protein Pdca_17700 [Pseudonocardia autotrophica]GEC28463.1 hypothetical protein PSA01_54920 [Pseudonocardia saturnea]